MNNPKQKNLLISFCDLTNFSKISKKLTDMEIFQYLSKIYQIIDSYISKNGGKVIKFMGDGAIIIFEEDKVDIGVVTLKNLKNHIDQFNKDFGVVSKLIVKVHFGSVVMGYMGTGESKHIDIIGNQVNIAATLKSNGFAISVEMFRKLNKESRKLFKKHTPKITYISVEESHKD